MKAWKDKSNIPMQYFAVIFGLLLLETGWAFSHHSFLKFRTRNATDKRSQNNQLFLSSPTKKSSSRFSPASDGSDRNKKTDTTPHHVIYQKIVRPSKALPDLLFLGYLVEYLESHFTIPSKLPMTYESIQPEEGSRCILAWNSPLSPSPDVTRMEVEVIGIYSEGKSKAGVEKNDKEMTTNSKKGPSSVPDMAMVVVRKIKESSASQAGASQIPQMMQNLFADSERQIVKALDRGLEEFMAGRIKFDDNERQKGKTHTQLNVKTAQEAIEAELVGSDHPKPKRDKHGISADNVVVDTSATTVPETKLPSPTTEKASDTHTSKRKEKQSTSNHVARAAAMATMKVKADGKPTTKNDRKNKETDNPNETLNDDYAVQAAREIARQRKRAIPIQEPIEDYAVAQARKMATVGKMRPVPNKIESKENIPGKAKSKSPSPSEASSRASKSSIKEPLNVEGMDINSFKIDDNLPRAFRTTISRPGDRAKVKKNHQKSSPKIDTQPLSQKDALMDGNEAEQVLRQEASSISVVNSNSANPAYSSTKENPTISDGAKDDIASVNRKKRKINLNVVDPNTDYLEEPYDVDKVSSPKEDSKPSAVKGSKSPPSQQQIERDIMKAAAEVMDDIAAQGQDMTPEELLEDVLKFDREQKEDNSEGTGFVGGAFEKAKEILREQSHKREARLRADVHEKEKRKEQSAGNAGLHEMTLQEELRQMFEAGQDIAERRITQTFSTSQSTQEAPMTKEDEDIVNDLVAREKSVSSHARVLEEELAELEVRINTSPGEEFDGQRENPIFDILSGPEVYNPNVDPETVNYPGAIPGTKNVRLPKDLDEAVKQARFASDVLQNLQQTDVQLPNGSTEVQFRVGKQELSQQQVENLRNVVAEASTIGLIVDPLTIMAERSRLQMVLDELWDQPEERFREIASNFKDLLLSDNFVYLLKERLNNMADRDVEALRREDETLSASHTRERELLGHLVAYAQVLLKETRALGAELEAQQLEIIRSICKVAMDPSHTTEEQAALALTDAVRDMRPLLDNLFVAYLKYAIAEEKGRLARAGVLDDPEHNQWLFVLQIVQQGVYKELSRGINRYLEHIWVSMSLSVDGLVSLYLISYLRVH